MKYIDGHYKSLSDSTMIQLPKKDLLKYIRTLENNWTNEIERRKNIQYNLKCVLEERKNEQ